TKPATAKPEPKKAAPAKNPAAKKSAADTKPATAKPEPKKAAPAKKPAAKKSAADTKAAPAQKPAEPLPPPVDPDFGYDDDFEEILEEPPLTPKEIEGYRRRLQNENGRLIRKSQSLQDQSLVRKDDDRPEELGGDDIARTTELRKASMSEDTSKQIQLALRRMEEGTYGKCQCCGKQIPRGRLNAIPQALYCIPCKESIEEEEKRTNFTNRNNE
ncbi:MAG: TraR/DksA family transcriptional regulator, partial [Kiritimatiellia bacterium]